MFGFYRWLSHICSMFQIILSQSCFNFTGFWALCNHVFLGSIKSLLISKMVPEILSIFFSSMVISSFGLFIPPHLHNSGRLKHPLGLKICFLQVSSVNQGPVEHKMRILVQPRQNVQRKSLQLVALTAIHSNPFSLQNFPFKGCYLEWNFWCVSLSLSTPWCSKHYAIPRAKYPFSIESLLEHQQLGVANPRLAWTQAEALQVLVWFPVN